VNNVAVRASPPTRWAAASRAWRHNTSVTINNQVDQITLSASGIHLPTQLPSGTAYTVTIVTQPTVRTCTHLQGATGQVSTATWPHRSSTAARRSLARRAVMPEQLTKHPK
jgi:hypothetical protein